MIVKENRVLSTGYNGAPAGMPHCDDVGCLILNGGCVRTSHAEANAIVMCAKFGVCIKGSTLYCTHSPCRECAKHIINAGIVQVIFENSYRSEDGLDLLRQAGVIVRQYSISDD